jgi:predicted NBD/HSP70 family sugar kinase
MNSAPTAGEMQQKDARGTSQLGLRLYNERLVLSLIRRHGSLSKVELARLTGLSAQTVSVIVRELEKSGLVVPGEPQRGRVGQPMVPFGLQPDGAFAVGLKVGRRSGELMLLDLAGKVRGRISQRYDFPSPQKLLKFVEASMEKLVLKLGPEARGRIAGLGVAAPFDLWNWGEELGAPPKVLDAWRDFDLTAELAKRFAFPVIPCNDATAACAAELLFAERPRPSDFAYFYVGYFIGGGLVLNGTLLQGRGGNAAALGSLPVPKAKGGAEQLIHAASLYLLEKAIEKRGRDARFMWDSTDDWSSIGKDLDVWLQHAAHGIAHAAVSVAAITEVSDVVIDGAMPTGVRARLMQATSTALDRMNQSGISPFTLTEGSVGFDARSRGAASLPLFANFIIDRDILFKGAE